MKRVEQLNRIFNIMINILAVIYIIFLVKVLFLRAGYIYNQDYMYNLIPLKTISEYIAGYEHYNFNTWFNNFFGNILLFVPFGFIYPYFIRSLRKVYKTIITLVITISLIEALQLITHLGSFDVDDIILNSIGGMIGIIIFKIYEMIIMRRLEITNRGDIQRRDGIT